jgi:hypothetical protein
MGIRPQSVGQGRPWTLYVLALLLYMGVVWATTPVDLGDTIYYVDEIQRHLESPGPGTLPKILDFGHLIWRPVALALYRVAAPFSHPVSHNDVRILITSLLVAVSLLAGVLTTLLMVSLFRRFRVPAIPSLIAIAALVSSNAVLNTSQSGSSYSAALAMLTLALWILIRPDLGRAITPRRAWAAGVAYAFCVSLWFPYAVVAPAVLAAAMIPWERWKDGIRLRDLHFAPAVHLALAATAVTTLVYGTAAWRLGISSPAEAFAWLTATNHGLRQSRNFLRVGMGLPRCCIAIGDEGILWKRFLFHDPYAPVSIMDLVQQSLAKLLIFYGGLLLMLVSVVRSHSGRVLLALTAIAAAPVFFFAVFLYEPSSIERFMPIFPFFFLLLAMQLFGSWFNARRRALALIFPAAIVLLNVGFHWNGRIAEKWKPTIDRINLFKPEAERGSNVAMVDSRTHYFLKDNPLNPSYPDRFGYWILIDLANERALRWRSEFAARAIRSWEDRHDVWVSSRVLSPAPLPEWDWVEGDDQSVHWKDLPEFFKQLEFDKTLGKRDGFVRLAQSSHNRELLDLSRNREENTKVSSR